jgi:hypothetical protein
VGVIDEVQIASLAERDHSQVGTHLQSLDHVGETDVLLFSRHSV